MRLRDIISPSNFRHLFLLTSLFAPIMQASAEKADSLLEAKISAGYTIFDGKKNVTTMTGHIELTRGTLIVQADRGVVSEGGEKSRNFALYGDTGSQVFFRQKRDGGADLWLEGNADRVEYDEKTELVKFISKARVRYLEGKRVTQEQAGEFLSYDSLNDVFIATNSSSGKYVPGAGRVTLTIEPKLEPKIESKTEKK
ncbi:MAG: lipopolysaccharide transport periplasmic protein LptA [Pseudomonadota bacterium]